MADQPLSGPPISRERVDAMWAKAAPRILAEPRRQRRALRIGVGAGLALASAVAVLLWVVTPGLPVIERGGVEVVADLAPSAFALPDGSRVDAAPETRLGVVQVDAERIELQVTHGRAHFAVAKHKARRFVVRAADVVVTVVGTRFTVERGDEVAVVVEEGVVEVEHRGSRVAVVAGQRWSSGRIDAASAEAAEDAAPGAADDAAPAAADDAAPGASDPDRAGERGPRDRTRARSRRAPKLAPVTDAETADQAFDAAMRARQSGLGEEARLAFADFLSRFPRDRRAALASFELGRLEMDVAHDPSAAVRALARALDLAPAAAFAEDARARLVRAHDQRGDRVACQAARTAYIARHPSGTYAAALAELCR